MLTYQHPDEPLLHPNKLLHPTSEPCNPSSSTNGFLLTHGSSRGRHSVCEFCPEAESNLQHSEWLKNTTAEVDKKL